MWPSPSLALDVPPEEKHHGFSPCPASSGGHVKAPSLYRIHLKCVTYLSSNIISVISISNYKHRQVHLDKVLIEVPDHLQLLALSDSGLLQDLLLLYEQILKKEKHQGYNI